MKTMEGFFSRASSNRLRTRRSDSPCHLETRSEEETEKKVAAASVATALARYDLPVPGGYADRKGGRETVGTAKKVARIGRRVSSGGGEKRP
jgi:hypothetical protein